MNIKIVKVTEERPQDLIERWSQNRMQELNEAFANGMDEEEYLEASMACNMYIDMPAELQELMTEEEAVDVIINGL